jgi:hypothetical protein
MLWTAFCDTHYQKYHRDYIEPTNEAEREFIVDTLYHMLVTYDKQQIDQALGYALRSTEGRRHTCVILDLMQQHIGQV